MADEIFKKLGFSNSEMKKVQEIVKGIYSSLLFRKIGYLMPLSGEDRESKRVEFLKRDIDDHRLLMIYCYNIFAEQMRFNKDSKDPMRFFSMPIEEVLERDDFYKKLILKEKETPLSTDERIGELQKKVNRSFMATKLIYADMLSKIKKTCNEILKIVGDNIGKDSQKLSIIMRFVINSVHIAETDSIAFAVAKKEVKDDDAKKDPCDVNKYLGVDWSFLGLFDELPEECKKKNDSIKISVVDAVKVDTKVGGARKTIRNK